MHETVNAAVYQNNSVDAEVRRQNLIIFDERTRSGLLEAPYRDIIVALIIKPFSQKIFREVIKSPLNISAHTNQRIR